MLWPLVCAMRDMLSNLRIFNNFKIDFVALAPCKLILDKQN